MGKRVAIVIDEIEYYTLDECFDLYDDDLVFNLKTNDYERYKRLLRDFHRMQEELSQLSQERELDLRLADLNYEEDDDDDA